MRWSEIPRGAKAYILYHTLITPGLIIWALFPLYLMETGYSILEVGAFFTAVNIATIPLTYLFGRLFNRWDIKKGLIAIDILDGVAYVMYGLAKGAIAPIMLFAGRAIEKLSTVLYPLYRAYEQIIYPEDKYEEIFAWHLRLPEISRLITFPIMGYLLGYVYPGPESYRRVFLLFGLFSAVTVAYIWFFLPSVGRKERITPEGFTFKAGEFKLLIAFETLFTLAWFLAPEIVLINYVVFVLHKTVFEVTLIACASSLASIIGTYASERVPKGKGFQAIGVGMLINAFYALVMALSPPFWLALVVYAVGDFGNTFWFPFYRSWMFKLIPKEKASEFHAAISSYRKLFGLFAPFVAGALASIHPTLPYAVSFGLFLMAGAMFAKLSRKRERGAPSPS
ncbi:MFS transporter [Thermococcus gammatolerans]|uniref:Permease, major facilitator superfamily n=1 Tax=Thermococcus gammatolerans (strain DSM 15229 / JCM 11827 / EJ3) TaxID=593117 RepID=C5A601_THEGJ|nr:MFS transporter [Thermococcus gammatolerans]ACS33663.1 Permease, major facilitator superfamily [Thermococcus gammatolerans EJ3]